ncbi:protein ELYS-like isoform X3 [Oscarella lobularis]|uniref:protein ELYS-like isoform X3 n=1 Tax=Oscarella lobularis TaxID=121494 RepID=UPI003313FA7E
MSFDSRIVQSPLMPHSVSVRAHFPESQHSTAQKRGKISSNGKWAWLTTGNVLETHEIDSKRTGSHRFGKEVERAFDVTIRDICEVRASDDRIFLCVAVQMSEKMSTLCLVDPNAEKVFKIVQCPYVISRLDAVDGWESEIDCRPLLHPVLRFFAGVVAMGTDCGRILLVDLRLDDDEEEEEEEDDVTRPRPLERLGRFQDGEVARAHAIQTRKHLYLELGDIYHRRGDYHFTLPDNSVVGKYAEVDAGVTSIRFIPRIDCLVVGFRFGAVQLWHLERVDLLCGLFNEKATVPVVQIAYQEPEEDPRLFCYLWIGRSESTSSDSVASLCMYSLMFSCKRQMGDLGMIYQDLQAVGLRFIHSLPQSSQLICCYCLGEDDLLNCDLDKSDSGEESRNERIGNVMTCVWESWEIVEGERRPVAFLGLFDLDRWYHSQMPAQIKLSAESPERGSSFFSFYSLMDVVETESILDFWLDPFSVRWFSSPGNDNQPVAFFMPSAIQLNAFSLTQSDVIDVHILGIQQKILTEISRLGSSVFSNPSELIRLLHVSGIHSDSHSGGGKSSKCNAILSVALKHGLVDFLTDCANALYSSDISVGGFGLSAFFEWAVNEVATLKAKCDESCLCLFDGNWKEGVLETTKKKWTHYAAQFKRLRLLFVSLFNQTRIIETTEPGTQQLEMRLAEVTLIQERLDLILWLVSVDLLPEEPATRNPAHGVFQVPYQNLLRKTNDRMIDRLLFDVGVDDIGRLWGKDFFGNGSYPPSSFYALLNVFFIVSSSPLARISTIYYFLLDLDACRSGVAKDFAVVFGVKNEVQLTVEGLWRLDHDDFETGISALTMVRLNDPLFPWIPSAVLTTLLLQDQFLLALGYLNSVEATSSHPKLYISVLLANERVDDAFFWRRRRFPDDGDSLLRHFIDECLRRRKLVDQMLQLPFGLDEEACLVARLQTSSHARARRVLLMYYVTRSRYAEAVQLNAEIEAMSVGEANRDEDEESAIARNALLAAYQRTLPQSQRKAATVFVERRRKVHKNKGRLEPKPLSVRLLPVSDDQRVWSKSSRFLAAVADGIFEAQSCLTSSDAAATPSFSPSSLNSRPFIGTPISTRPTPRRRSERATPSLTSRRDDGDGDDDDDDDERLIDDEQMELVESSPPRHRSSLPTLGLSSKIADMKARAMALPSQAETSVLATPTLWKLLKVRFRFGGKGRQLFLQRPSYNDVSTPLNLLQTPQSILKSRPSAFQSRKKHLSFAVSPLSDDDRQSGGGGDGGVGSRDYSDGDYSGDVDPHASERTIRRIRFTPTSSGEGEAISAAAAAAAEESSKSDRSSDGEITFNFSRSFAVQSSPLPSAKSSGGGGDDGDGDVIVAKTSPSERLAKLRELKESVDKRLGGKTAASSPSPPSPPPPPPPSQDDDNDDDSFFSAHSDLDDDDGANVDVSKEIAGLLCITEPRSWAQNARSTERVEKKDKSLVSFSPYAFSPPTLLVQSPVAKATAPAATAIETPLLSEAEETKKKKHREFIFSPPLTRSGSRRRQGATATAEPATPLRRSRRIQERTANASPSSSSSLGDVKEDDLVLVPSFGRQVDSVGGIERMWRRKGKGTAAAKPALVEAGRRLRSKMLRQHKY